MPAIRRQEIFPNGFLVETTRFGTLQITIERTGTSYTLTATRNGQQIGSRVFDAPTRGDVETWVNRALDTFFSFRLGVRILKHLNFAWRITNLNPLRMIIVSSDHALPDNWWQRFE